MAKINGNAPAFITGANAKIRVAGLTWAFASDVSYQITVDTIPVETFGRYEAVSNEPVNYSVAGELSVVRYTAVATSTSKLTPGRSTNLAGNGIGEAQVSNGFDPSSIMGSGTFDIDVYQKNQAITTAADGSPTVSTTPVIHIGDCRFTRKSASLNKRGILVDRLAFVGILANDDSYTAGHSGDDDLT